MNKHIANVCQLVKTMTMYPRLFTRVAATVPSGCSAYNFSHTYEDTAPKAAVPVPPPGNPLWEYFQNHVEGRGIWKWEHYFDIYHRHFARFVGRQVNIMEIGIYGGGSLDMWRSYFGEQSHIYGVDIEEACRAYQDEHISVFIGDQGDRAFWRAFRKSVGGIDVIIDDGGHTPEQQQITLEEMLPSLRPGGMYLCEDIQENFNGFAAFAAGLVNELNGLNPIPGSLLQSKVSQFQASVHSIHFYPYVVVIEKNLAPISKLSAPRRGTDWPPRARTRWG